MISDMLNGQLRLLNHKIVDKEKLLRPQAEQVHPPNKDDPPCNLLPDQKGQVEWILTNRREEDEPNRTQIF